MPTSPSIPYAAGDREADSTINVAISALPNFRPFGKRTGFENVPPLRASTDALTLLGGRRFNTAVISYRGIPTYDITTHGSILVSFLFGPRAFHHDQHRLTCLQGSGAGSIGSKTEAPGSGAVPEPAVAADQPNIGLTDDNARDTGFRPIKAFALC